MPAYFLFHHLETLDAPKLEEYKRLVGPTVARYGGRYAVRDARVELVEGTWVPDRPVVIEFPTSEAARAWYDSPEYRPLKAMRFAALRASGVLIEAPPAPEGAS